MLNRIGGNWAGWGRLAVLAPCLLVAGVMSDRVAASEPASDQGQNEGLFQRLDANSDGVIEASETPSEHRRLFDRLLRTGDKNGDGRLDVAEFSFALTPTTPDKPIEAPAGDSPAAKAARLLLLKLDTTGDQTLTRAEAPAGLKDVFDEVVDRVDRNKDERASRFELNRAGPQLMNLARRISRQQRWEVASELAELKQQQGDTIYRFDKPLSPIEMLGDPQRARELFNQIDGNGDNRLTIDETPAPARARFRRLFDLADADRDKQLTRKEFLVGAERVSKFRHRNDVSMANEASTGSDTKPTDELMGGTVAPATESVGERLMQRMVKRSDKNGDGRITRAEAEGQLARRFERIDRNSDGELDARELSAETKRLEKRLRKAEQ